MCRYCTRYEPFFPCREDWKRGCAEEDAGMSCRRGSGQSKSEIETDIQGYDIDAEALKQPGQMQKWRGVRKPDPFSAASCEGASSTRSLTVCIANPPYLVSVWKKSALPQLYREIGELPRPG